VVTKDGCEIMTRFPGEELTVAGKRYYTSGRSPLGTREIESHLNRAIAADHQEVVGSRSKP